MFAPLKRAFHGDRDPAGEKLTNRSKIVSILRSLKTDHELLSVSVAGSRDKSNSAILGIKESRDCFYLDELSSRDAHDALVKNRKARIECRLQGMELRFACHLVKANTESGIALYEIAIPKAMFRLQRRQHFRLRLAPGLLIPVTIPSLEGEAVTGEAFDLSASGLGAFFRTRNVPSRGLMLRNISISLPGSRPFKTSIEVRFARLDSAHHMLRLGGRFMSLDRKQERQLEQFLAEQQRKLRRHQPR
jgi:c-di-GMP-binding flagellar brake protein YcgR